MANHGHYGGNEGGTRQGIYVCSPSGKFLASINSNDPDRVLGMLERGLKAWNDLPADERRLSSSSEIKPQHRWEDSYPSDGLVLTMVTRDLPEKCDPSAPCAEKWNQDQVWFSQDEARSWLPADPQPGQTHQLPEDLVYRLAGLHLVDTVKGQSARFSRRGIAGSHIDAKVVGREGSEVKLQLTGRTSGMTDASWWRDTSNGIVLQLLGHATFDLGSQRFTEFEMLALGRRWGYTRFNGRRRDPEHGPVGFVFQLASERTVPIAPAFVFSYDADWLARPNR